MRPVYFFLGLALSVVAAISFVAASTVDATPQRLGQARFDGWGYTVFAEPDGSGATRAHIEYDRATPADLHKYAATNRALARELTNKGHSTLWVTVSFRRPLSVPEFQAWANSVALRVDDFQLRLLGPDGRRWTLGGAPSGGELIRAADLQRTLDRLAAKGVTNLQGVIVAEGQIAAASYERLATDPAVFLADVTPSAAAAHIAATVPTVDQARLSVVVAPVFAALEDLGLVNLR
jgi:hypothetical protein